MKKPEPKYYPAQGQLLKELTVRLDSCISALSKKEGPVENLLKKDRHYQQFIARDLSAVGEGSLLHDFITHLLALDALLKKCSLDNLLLSLSSPSTKLTVDHSKDLLEIETSLLRFLRNPYDQISNIANQELLEIIATSEKAVKGCLTLMRCYTFFPDEICSRLLPFFGKKEPTSKIIYTLCTNFIRSENTWNDNVTLDYEKQFLKICAAFLFKHQNLEEFYCELVQYHQEHRPKEQLASIKASNQSPKSSHYHVLSEFVEHIAETYCSHLSRLHALDENNFSFFAFKISLEQIIEDIEETPEAEKIRRLYAEVDKERTLNSPTKLTSPEDIILLKKFYRLQLRLYLRKNEATFEQLTSDTSSEGLRDSR